jgi:hypothetical protein
MAGGAIGFYARAFGGEQIGSGSPGQVADPRRDPDR